MVRTVVESPEARNYRPRHIPDEGLTSVCEGWTPTDAALILQE